jgi:DMSO/TMAO reductase YedYZ molybdopterin-dependent catalytic subunit
LVLGADIVSVGRLYIYGLAAGGGPGSCKEALNFAKSLALDHARDGEVMIAYAMNGEQLPLLNGFPLPLVVPGWYAAYWIKMLNDIEVLEAPTRISG